MAALGDRNPVARWQRQTLDAAMWTLAATGFAWLVAHYLFGAGNETIGLPHPSEPWWMRAHGFAGFVLLVAFGSLLTAHVPRGWRMPARSVVEVTLLALLAGAIATAYLLYYFAPDTVRAALGWIHTALGAGAGIALIWHRLRRATSAKQA